MIHVPVPWEARQASEEFPTSILFESAVGLGIIKSDRSHAVWLNQRQAQSQFNYA
jgi:hypothetical protein